MSTSFLSFFLDADAFNSNLVPDINENAFIQIMEKFILFIRHAISIIIIAFVWLSSINHLSADSTVYVKRNDSDNQPSGQVRTPPFIPLSVTLTDDYNLSFAFTGNVGVTTITILDSNDTVVYYAVVDSGTQPLYEVSLETFDAGQYHLLIKYATNELYGEFTL
ncbi:MAG: DUF3244 domain-containing protein [Bacteroidales bacterium]|nr:DUF3244 domain-containing protein [Bacteroidales bacterium]